MLILKILNLGVSGENEHLMNAKLSRRVEKVL